MKVQDVYLTQSKESFKEKAFANIKMLKVGDQFQNYIHGRVAAKY